MISGLDDEYFFYLIVVVLAIPAILLAVKFGLFLTLPRFILRRYFMEDYNKERSRVQKRKQKEERKRARRNK